MTRFAQDSGSAAKPANEVAASTAWRGGPRDGLVLALVVASTPRRTLCRLSRLTAPPSPSSRPGQPQYRSCRLEDTVQLQVLVDNQRDKYMGSSPAMPRDETNGAFPSCRTRLLVSHVAPPVQRWSVKPVVLRMKRRCFRRRRSEACEPEIVVMRKSHHFELHGQQTMGGSLQAAAL